MTSDDVGKLGTTKRKTAKLLAGPEIEHYHQAIAVVVAETFEQVYPLFLLATRDDPLPAIRKYLGEQDAFADNPEYPLQVVAEKTFLELATLIKWVAAIERVDGLPGGGAPPPEADLLDSLSPRASRITLGEGERRDLPLRLIRR